MKLLNIFISLCLTFLPSYVMSQELKITSIRKGQEAPFTGILMTQGALSKIEADLRLEVDLCANKCELEKGEINLLFQKEMMVINAEVDGLKQFIEVKNRRIEKLEQVIEERDNSWFTPIVAIASFTLGVATTVGITYAVNR